MGLGYSKDKYKKKMASKYSRCQVKEGIRMLEIVKKSKEKKVGLEEVKEDLLKVISKVEGLEQKIENLNHKVKRLQQQTGFTM